MNSKAVRTLGSVVLLVVLLANVASAGDWKLKTTEGKSVRYSELQAEGPVLITFWALWCAPCLKELPHIDKLAKDFEGKVSVLAVNADSQRSVNRVRAYLKSKGYAVTVPLDTSGELARKLQIGTSIPFVVLFDAEGNEVYRHTGYKEGDEEILREHLESVVASAAKE